MCSGSRGSRLANDTIDALMRAIAAAVTRAMAVWDISINRMIDIGGDVSGVTIAIDNGAMIGQVRGDTSSDVTMAIGDVSGATMGMIGAVT